MDISSLGWTDYAAAGRPSLTAEQVSQNRDLVKAASAINASGTLGSSSELVFLMDRVTHRAIMRVIDRKTKEVVMQLPPDYVLRLARDLQKSPQFVEEF